MLIKKELERNTTLLILFIPMPILVCIILSYPPSSVLGYASTAHGWPTTIYVGHGGWQPEDIFEDVLEQLLKKVFDMRMCKDTHGEYVHVVTAYTYEYPYTHTYTYAYAYTYTYPYTYIYIYINLCTEYTYPYTYTCTYAYA